jgi:MFS family permease
VTFFVQTDLPPETRRNINCFLWFRVLFNCRFYYPIYTILFLDFGLSLREFAVLNALWAVAIVVLEVPSGALADRIGRKKLVVLAGGLMILEMIVLLMTPVGAGPLLFFMFLINRVFSGAAEAAASGADEALVYDSLPETERADLWAGISGRLLKIQSAVFIFVTVVGAYSYDPSFVNKAAAWLGIENVALTQNDTLKFPIVLNLLMAIGAFITALRFFENPTPKENGTSASPVRDSFRNTLKTGRWILRTPTVLTLISLGMLFDSFIRLFYTISSQFYRLLSIPERDYGLIGAAGSILGITTAFIVVKMVRSLSPQRNFFIVTVLVLIGMTGLAIAQSDMSYWGVLLVVPLWLAMRFLHYFLSQYINAATDSEHRATVLSFRGLALNLSYGAITLLFGAQTWFLRNRLDPTEGSEEQLKEQVFADAMPWWPFFYVVAAVATFLVLRVYCRAGPGKLLGECDPRVVA